ncbi:hypothetical protein [uncultured Rikenella sp.]|uniref:hypothetical protein n=1 Tax=uncultured Rikenella sp. TaxID=368003 RepID=UPI002634CAC8|nr:hypothetical protein [uncultured Rikenella sp.]
MCVKIAFFQPCCGGIFGKGSAPGYRIHDAGGAIGVGNYGYSWSSAVSGINGRLLWFQTQGLSPNPADGRAYGLQLRCLSE